MIASATTHTVLLLLFVDYLGLPLRRLEEDLLLLILGLPLRELLLIELELLELPRLIVLLPELRVPEDRIDRPLLLFIPDRRVDDLDFVILLLDLEFEILEEDLFLELLAVAVRDVPLVLSRLRTLVLLLLLSVIPVLRVTLPLLEDAVVDFVLRALFVILEFEMLLLFIMVTRLPMYGGQ